MPLDHGYGVAIGILTRYYREDPDNYGKYYHGFIDLDINGTNYECAIDVDTHNNEIQVEHRIVEIASDDIAPLLALNAGYTNLNAISNSGAIDFIRSLYLLPIKMIGCLTKFIYSILPIRFPVRVANNPNLWSKGNGTETLDRLEEVINDGNNARVLVFGEPYHYGGQGMHNIHQNQGDPPGTNWWDENGIWQDGCIIFVKEDGRNMAFLSKFSSQAYLTDNDGHPLTL